MNPAHLPPLPHSPSRSEVRRTEHALLRMLKAGLAQEGIITGRRRDSTLHVDLHEPYGVWLTSYRADLGIWRITYGLRDWDDSYAPLLETRELSLLREEFSDDTGVELARLLRDPNHRWELFAHDPGYPGYAWSKRATQACDDDRQRRQAYENRARERRAAR